MISNKHEELIVVLRGDIYFVKFINNPEEDNVEPGVIFGRSFVRTSSSTRRHLTPEETKKEALALRISQKFALLEEVRPVLETMAYHDKYKKMINEIWKDKLELDGLIVKEEEEAIKKESDSDDQAEYEIKRNKFGALMYGSKPAPYLNCNDPSEKLLALQALTNLFRKIIFWKKAVNFLGSLPVPLKQVNWKPDYKGCYTKEEEAA
nr:hypothetical protein [Tanacetum cinerariifolium]